MTTDHSPEFLSLIRSLQDLVDAGGHAETVCGYLREWADARYAPATRRPDAYRPTEPLAQTGESAARYGIWKGTWLWDDDDTPAAVFNSRATAEACAADYRRTWPKESFDVLPFTEQGPSVGPLVGPKASRDPHPNASREAPANVVDALEADLVAGPISARAPRPKHTEEARVRGRVREPVTCKHCGVQLGADDNHPGVVSVDDNVVACRDFLSGRVEALEEMLNGAQRGPCGPREVEERE